ncbi:unnamed protein product [Rangifer tarandus platyrhynchus]|uniref:Uncharacterized protein n=1 Tax=Rangifer tarandus platyrhynchus TaxID=3082113 RepID=A0AC59YEI3_RANTA
MGRGLRGPRTLSTLSPSACACSVEAPAPAFPSVRTRDNHDRDVEPLQPRTQEKGSGWLPRVVWSKQGSGELAASPPAARRPPASPSSQSYNPNQLPLK